MSFPEHSTLTCLQPTPVSVDLGICGKKVVRTKGHGKVSWAQASLRPCPVLDLHDLLFLNYF